MCVLGKFLVLKHNNQLVKWLLAYLKFQQTNVWCPSLFQVHGFDTFLDPILSHTLDLDLPISLFLTKCTDTPPCQYILRGTYCIKRCRYWFQTIGSIYCYICIYSSLFMASPHKSPFTSRESLNAVQQADRMIESGSLEEKEYVEQHDKYFHDIAIASTARRKISLNLQCTGKLLLYLLWWGINIIM